MSYTKFKKKLRVRINSLISHFFFGYKRGNTILLTATDGLGDNIVREQLLSEIRKKYRSEKILVLTKEKTVPLLSLFGFDDILIFSDSHRKKLFGELSLIYKLKKSGIKEIIVLEFNSADNLFLRCFKGIPIIGYYNKDTASYIGNILEYKANKERSILYGVQAFYNCYFQCNKEVKALTPNIIQYFDNAPHQTDNTVTIGLGANGRNKTLTPKIFADAIVEVQNYLKPNKIILLGAGKTDEKLASDLMGFLDGKEIVVENQVNKISLLDSYKTILYSKLFLGVDSGLYNFASFVGVNTIVIMNEPNGFNHDFLQNVTCIYPTLNENTKDYYYGSKKLNSLDMNLFREELKNTFNQESVRS